MHMRLIAHMQSQRLLCTVAARLSPACPGSPPVGVAAGGWAALCGWRKILKAVIHINIHPRPSHPPLFDWKHACGAHAENTHSANGLAHSSHRAQLCGTYHSGLRVPCCRRGCRQRSERRAVRVAAHFGEQCMSFACDTRTPHLAHPFPMVPRPGRLARCTSAPSCLWFRSQLVPTWTAPPLEGSCSTLPERAMACKFAERQADCDPESATET